MQITCSQAFEFQLQNYFAVPITGYVTDQRNIALKSCRVSPSGGTQSVPDSVSFNPLFVLALAAGQVTIVDEPTGVVTLSAGVASSNIALPQTGENVVIFNPGKSDISVLLGDSSVTVTEVTGTAVFPGSAILLPLGSNTYLAAIALGSTPITINVSVE